MVASLKAFEIGARGAPPHGSESSESESPALLTLRAHVLAAAASKIARDGNQNNGPPELQFLFAHLDAVQQRARSWTESFSAYCDLPNECDVPLLQLARTINLTPIEVLAVALTAAVEDDVMTGRTLAHLQAPLGGSRPTLGFLAAAMSEMTAGNASAMDVLATGVAIQSGLLTLMNDSAPLPERAVGVPLHLCQALNGNDGLLQGTTIGIDGLNAVPLPASFVDEADKQARALLSSSQRVLILRTGFNEEGRAVAVQTARAMGRRALFIEHDKTAALGPWLLMRQLLPVFCLNLGPGERKLLPAIPAYDGPVLVLCGPDGGVETNAGAALNWTLPVPAVDERVKLWEIALGDSDLASELARHHRHCTGRIAQLGRIAHHRSVLNGHTQPMMADVVAASWSGEGVRLESIAQPITDSISDDALVLTSTLQTELTTFLLRCRARDGLVEGLGPSTTARYHPGVRALFIGPSGTGKTMAAGWLATKLGLPLYRVDLASVISKYIGETEKNLAHLLARAERAEVVLLFDEADSLFGKRTDVKEANDRFANAQTNYLLQRIESFDGITILTSNSRSRFDDSFTRRLDMIVEFPTPGPEERRSLWQSHLGSNHALNQKQLNQMSASADLCGGHIRNAVLTAAVLSHKDGRSIEYADVMQGLASEYRKLGRQMPAELLSTES
ncbi:MAG TPA: ATP-binding protein [Pyrinomonadaceae bacterium]|nr:ATP-binding protein [Pyrinomonadaceae bacterium]